MKRYKWVIILVNLILLLGYFNFSIFEKEKTLKNGQLVLLKLAPVDPRSLMQGDYMNLRYEISEEVNAKGISKRGYYVVKLNQHQVAEKVRLQKEQKPLNAGEFLIRYSTSDNRNVNMGAESYFFQEGEAEKFDNAKYGGLKIDDKGNSVLIGLYNEKLKLIK
ncbi:MAG: GDYXXLXY domain-containing protein [Pelobium sp.]